MMVGIQIAARICPISNPLTLSAFGVSIWDFFGDGFRSYYDIRSTILLFPF